MKIIFKIAFFGRKLIEFEYFYNYGNEFFKFKGIFWAFFQQIWVYGF